MISGASAGAGGGGATDEDGSDTDTGTDGETDDEETDGTDGAKPTVMKVQNRGRHRHTRDGNHGR